MVKSLHASTADLRDASLILESEKSSGAANGNPLQYSCLENFMNNRAWTGYSPWGLQIGRDCAHMQGKANGPAVPLLDICPEKTISQKDTYMPLFTVALFPVHRT